MEHPGVPLNAIALASDSAEAALIRAARALTSHLDLDGVCEAILDAAEEVFGATSSGFCFTIQPPTGCARESSAVPEPRPIAGCRWRWTLACWGSPFPAARSSSS